MSAEAERSFSSISYLGVTGKVDTLFQGILTIRKIVRTLKIDVVHSHLIQSDLLTALTPISKSVPKIRTLHTSSLSIGESRLTKIIWFLMRYLKNNFQVLVSCTAAASKFADETRQESPVHLIVSNGIKIDEPRAPQEKSFEGYFLVLARFHVVKDFPTLFKSFSIARAAGMKVKLVCAGSGLSWSNAELMDSLGSVGGVTNLDLLPFQEDVRSLLDGAKFLVISSSYGEALPMVGLEALANGVPVISTNVGDCRALVLDKRFLAAPSDAKSLADAILEASKLSKREYRRLSESSFQLAREKFSLESTVAFYEEIYSGDVK
jgi:glycosyltransferase involved in cell wall biosynthesis